MEIIATVKFITSKKMQTRNGLSALLKYCMQEKKTIFNDKKLVSGVNCVANSAFNEMMNTKIQYGKTAGRIFYHLIQSFHPDENITPEKAHQMAVRFASEQFKGYETVVSTHIDQEHIHSHFVINSVNFETGYKYHADKNELQRLRNESDKLCLEYGLSVIKPKDKKIKPMSAREYRSADKGQSWKLALAMAIDDAMCYAVSREHFIELMENEGYEVKWTDSRKNITYTAPNGMKCRDSRLHEEKYLKEMMENEFGIRQKIIDSAEVQTCVTVTEKNWTALLSTQTAQIELLKTLLDTADTLTTKQELIDYMNQQMDYLTKNYCQAEETLKKFHNTLAKQAEMIQTQTSESVKEWKLQAGKMNEEFSRQLSSEKQTLNKHYLKLTLLSLMPTLVLVIWELVRCIWLPN